MLLAQAPPGFPPAFFWICIVAINAIVFGSVTTMVVSAIRADMSRRIRERELAAQLIDQMLREHHLSAGEIEQIVNSYWQRGAIWRKLSERFARPFQCGSAIPPQKPVVARTVPEFYSSPSK